MGKRALGVSIREKADGTKVYIVRWEEYGGEERQCKSREFPRPELEGTLEAFGQFIPYLCLIPASRINYTIIAGASIKYPKTGHPTLTLGVSLGLENGLDFDFESPAVPLHMEKYTLENAQTWAEKCSAMAKLLCDEIIFYAEGKRAQQQLEFEQKEESEKEEGGDN